MYEPGRVPQALMAIACRHASAGDIEAPAKATAHKSNPIGALLLDLHIERLYRDANPVSVQYFDCSLTATCCGREAMTGPLLLPQCVQLCSSLVTQE